MINKKMILTWPDGDSNVNTEITVTNEGIDIDWIGLVPWDFIDEARKELNQNKSGDEDNV